MSASFTVAVYQRRLGATVELTSLGLGPVTQRASAQSLPKAEEKLRDELRKVVQAARPLELARFDFRRGTRLERVHLEVDLRDAKRRKVTGLCPLVVEPRPLGDGRTMDVCYHPARQHEWFPRHAYEGLASTAESYFGGTWAALDDDEIARLWSNTKDSLRAISFNARPRTLLGELPDRKKGVWDDLDADPLQSGKKSRGGMTVLSRLGTDLTPAATTADAAATLGLPRSPYREQLQVLLGAKRKQSVILVGAPGCGKSTILRQLVHDLLATDDYATHQNLDRVTHVWRILGKQLIAGMSRIGQWEQRCVELLDDLRGRSIVLAVPDLHLFGRIGRARDSDRALSDFFRGPVGRGEMIVVGECTPEQLQRLEEDDPAFAAAFARVHVAPAGRAETFKMMLARAREIEVTTQSKVSPLAFETVLDLGEGLFPQHALPGRAVDLLERVAKATPNRTIDSDAIVAHLSSTTGLPLALLAPKTALPVAEIAAKLGARVIGQEAAVREAADVVARVRAGLVDPRRPWAVYLFTGPTGTGKTELAKALAGYLYGAATEGSAEGRLVRVDMSELAGPDGVARLIGDAWSPEGSLTSAVLAQPFSVVLLDEVEKAHPAVLNLLLQLFDDGRLTDAAGNTASFTQTVIVMTSNLGARQRAPVGFDEASTGLLHDVARAVREFFPPELFNRIDAVVPFVPLTPEVAVEVTRKELGKLFARPGLVDRNAFVEVADAAVLRIARDALRAEDGARSLKRYIEDRVATLLGEKIAESPGAAMQVLRVSDGYGGLEVVAEPLVEATPVAGRYALEAVWNKPLAELRESLPEVLATLDRIESSDRLAELCETLRHHLSAHNRGVREHGELLFNIDWMRSSIDELRDRTERIVVASRDLHLHALEDAIAQRDHHEPARVPWKADPKPIGGRMRFDFGRQGTWWEVFSAIAETHILARALDKVTDPGQHAVYVELVPFGRGHALRDEMLAAYLRGRGTVDEIAWVSGGEVKVGGAGAGAALGPSPVVVVKIVGLCIADYLELEHGTHVWQQTVLEPELLRVRVLDASTETSARAIAAAWLEAKQRGAREATQLLPIVRTIHFDPPSGKAPAPLELEDFVLGMPYATRVTRLADAFTTLWLLRVSRVEEGS